MPTKAELESLVKTLELKITRLENATPKVVEKIVEKVVERVVEVPAPPAPLEPPSPVDRGQMYVESHPILGITRQANVTENSIGDGRIGDGATIVRKW